MLEFHSIQDHEPEHEFVLGGRSLKGRFLGGLTAADFSELHRFGIIPDETEFERVTFVDDFCLRAEQVHKLLRFATDRYQQLQATPGFRSVAIEKLVEILETAVRRRSGTIALCD